MADHPLRPATDRSLGGPLPRQLANRTRDPLVAIACEQRPPFHDGPCDPSGTCGISTPLGVLFPSTRQVSHALLTRSPLYSRSKLLFHVRLACLIHAASVRSEPGSNSPWYENMEIMRGLSPRMDQLQGITCHDEQHRPPGKDLPGFRSHVRYSVFKDRRHVKRLPRCEKRTGNLASTAVGVNRVVLRGGLCSCSTGNIGRPDVGVNCHPTGCVRHCATMTYRPISAQTEPP